MTLAVIKTNEQQISESVLETLDEAKQYVIKNGSVSVSLTIVNANGSAHTVQSRAASRRDVIAALVDQLFMAQMP